MDPQDARLRDFQEARLRDNETWIKEGAEPAGGGAPEAWPHDSEPSRSLRDRARAFGR